MIALLLFLAVTLGIGVWAWLRDRADRRRHATGIPQLFWDWYEWNLARRNEEWVVVRRIGDKP